MTAAAHHQTGHLRAVTADHDDDDPRARPSAERRPQVRVGSGPETIRALTAALDSGVIPETYVTDGQPVVVEAVSGTGEVTAGDQDAPHPLRVSVLRPPLLAALLAQH